MGKYQFVFFSGTICFTAPHIGEVRKEISRRVERGRVESVRHDIELQMVGHCDGIPVVLYSCYLYNDSFELSKARKTICKRLGSITLCETAETVPQEKLRTFPAIV